jgi:hypothetical protein
MPRLLLLAALVLSGCRVFGPEGNTPDDVTLEARYDADAHAVDLRLVNRTSGVVGYNLCFADLRSVETGRSLPRLADACILIVRGLRPGEAADFTATLHPDSIVAPGRYQASYGLEFGGERREVVSDVFEIE